MNKISILVGLVLLSYTGYANSQDFSSSDSTSSAINPTLPPKTIEAFFSKKKLQFSNGGGWQEIVIRRDPATDNPLEYGMAPLGNSADVSLATQTSSLKTLYKDYQKDKNNVK